VILTSQSSREVAERQATRIANLIPEERIDYVQMRVPGQSGLRYVVQVGRPTRVEAEALCQQLKAQGAACMVLRN
jgi:hypothetical protein